MELVRRVLSNLTSVPVLLTSQETQGSDQRQAAAISGEVQAEVSPEEERRQGRLLGSVKMAPPDRRQMATAAAAAAAAAAVPVGWRSWTYHSPKQRTIFFFENGIQTWVHCLVWLSFYVFWHYNLRSVDTIYFTRWVKSLKSLTLLSVFKTETRSRPERYPPDQPLARCSRSAMISASSVFIFLCHMMGRLFRLRHHRRRLTAFFERWSYE